MVFNSQPPYYRWKVNREKDKKYFYSSLTHPTIKEHWHFSSVVKEECSLKGRIDAQP